MNIQTKWGPIPLFQTVLAVIIVGILSWLIGLRWWVNPLHVPPGSVCMREARNVLACTRADGSHYLKADLADFSVVRPTP